MNQAAGALQGAVDPARSRKLLDRLFRHAVIGTSLVVLALIFLIFVFVGREALPVLTSDEVHQEVTPGAMFLPQAYGTEEAPESFVWQPVAEHPKYSLLPLVLGTLKVTLIALLFAIPFALLAALFTTEFAPRWAREVIKPVIELLAGIPSVVLGFFALLVLASWLQALLDLDFRLNAITAGIGLGLAVIPILFTVAEDALRAVPQSFRDASAALGASRWQTAWKVVLPAALPGVFAGIILAFGRAMGETMIVLMASGNAATTSLNFDEPIRTLSATIAAELGEVVHGSPHYHVLFFVGLLLFAGTFLLNWGGVRLVGRLRRRLLGA